MRNKKAITIGFIVLILIIIILLLTRCSNSVETQNTSIKTDKTTEKTKKKTTTKKIESTSSQKSEVKQEEKKEETAKADSSNKSNTSDSKKDNTASTTNTSSNKNNTSSSKPSNSSNSSSSKPSNNNSSNNSKPAEHTHDWVAQYKTVNVPEKGHNEQVLVQDAWDEQVPITEMKEHSICNQCGADITGDPWGHNKQHALNYEPGGFHSEWIQEVTGYKTVHHDAVYETRYVVDSPATTKQELTGYKCSCGKTKSN